MYIGDYMNWFKLLTDAPVNIFIGMFIVAIVTVCVGFTLGVVSVILFGIYLVFYLYLKHTEIMLILTGIFSFFWLVGEIFTEGMDWWKRIGDDNE